LRTSFKVKGQGHKLTSSVRLISASSSFEKQNAALVSLQVGGGIPCWPNPSATLLVKNGKSVHKPPTSACGLRVQGTVANCIAVLRQLRSIQRLGYM